MARYRTWAVLGVLVAMVAASLADRVREDRGENNLYTFQAQSFLDGRLDIDAPDRPDDIAFYQGRAYVVFPPFPAVLLMPIVATFGFEATRSIVVALLFTVIGVIALYRALCRLDVPESCVPWLVVAFFMGTGYWHCLRHSTAVWCFAQIIGTTFLILAIGESLGKSRPVLVGVFAALAFLSRQLSVWSFPFLALVILAKTPTAANRDRALRIGWFAIPTLLGVSVYMAFNWARFGSPFDTGYSHLALGPIFEERVGRYGHFDPAYLLFNFVHMFIQGIHIEFRPPAYVLIEDADKFGTSLTFASPFLFVAFWARGDRRIVWGAWVAVCLALVHVLLYNSNGYTQLNTQRYAMDFIPVLMVLVALGTLRVPEKLWKAAVVYSVALNVLVHVGIPIVKRIQDALAGG